MKYVFLHGLGQDASSWDRTIDAMGVRADAACPDLAALLRGGEAGYPRLYDAFSAYCAKIDGPFHLCGLSLGGILALHYGIENPARVRSLALIGARAAMPRRLLAVQNAVFCVMPDRMFGQTGLGKGDVIRLSRSMMDLDFRPRLDSVTCPVLVACGEKDRANRRAAEELSGRIRRAELRMIEGAGHEANVDAPEKLGEALSGFYQKTGG